MALQQWALARLQQLSLPLDESELEQVISYTITLSDAEAARHLENLLGDSPEVVEFIAAFVEHRAGSQATGNLDGKTIARDVKNSSAQDMRNGLDTKGSDPPAYATLPGPSSGASSAGGFALYCHTNRLIEAGKLRARDEQEMQQRLQDLQNRYGIFNSEIEPEHESDYCSCPIHQYQQLKWSRVSVQDMWSKAVVYPGEKYYSDGPTFVFTSNPYKYGVGSPYGWQQTRSTWGFQKPRPSYHASWLHQTIALNNRLNREAQAKVDAQEPRHNIWEDDVPDISTEGKAMNEQAATDFKDGGSSTNKLQSRWQPEIDSKGKSPSRFSSFKKSLGIKSSAEKNTEFISALKRDILAEEQGRWPDEEWRRIIAAYLDKIGMAKKVAELRSRYPIQYLHLLRAGYFEPIPVAWANQASNPLKFSIEAATGWRGITPAWRGYEDLAEERLYWVLNHREGSVGMRMKPDFMSEMNMAQERMARAVEPPPLYFSADDTCHLQHTSDGYSKQVMPPPFRPYDRPEKPTDDTMILLDVSGSMDFEPVRPVYDQFLITGYVRSTQPKNKDVAKAIVRRFTDAMANHDRMSAGYDLITFSSQAKHIGTVNHANLNQMWQRHVRFGGGTRVMTGWQKVKELHFQKHSESAVHHPVYGWQAGPDTPILRLLLLLDGEATDMDEFELDLLGLSWAHVTIFLIGVDGCPHHHRHANELERISQANHHVSFVDAQGNCPERFVTHELLKRHLGYDISMREFEQMEQLPAYEEVVM